jgi:hypothetical protein
MPAASLSLYILCLLLTGYTLVALIVIAGVDVIGLALLAFFGCLVPPSFVENRDGNVFFFAR